MTVDQELDIAHAEYSSSEAEWTWRRVLSVGWLITWRAAAIFVAIIIVGILVIGQGTSIEVSFIPGETATLIIMGAVIFVLGVVPLTISAKMSTRKNYQDFQIQIQILGDQGALLQKLSFGQATRMGWLLLWRPIGISLAVTVVLALPLIMLGFYELNDSGNKMTVATPWFIFLPIYIFTMRAALRREYIGFHLMPVSFTEISTENHT